MTKCQAVHVQSADDCIKAAAHDILSLIRAVIRNAVWFKHILFQKMK